jgi:hypothetical protein
MGNCTYGRNIKENWAKTGTKSLNGGEKSMKKLLITVVAVVVVMVTIASAQATIKTLAVTQVWQHKDTNMWCNVCGAGVIHPVHSPGCNLL